MVDLVRDRILQKVEDIEQTLGQPVQADKGRDHILHQVRIQIKELQNALQNGVWGSAAQMSNAKGTGKLDETPKEQQFVQPKDNFLEKWKVCECGQSDCPTCQAEWEAINSANAWTSTHKDIDPYGHYPCQNDLQVCHKVMAEDLNTGTYDAPLCEDEEMVIHTLHVQRSSDSKTKHELKMKKEGGSYSFCQQDDDMLDANASGLIKMDMDRKPIRNDCSHNSDPENASKKSDNMVIETLDESQLVPEDQSTVACVDRAQGNGDETQLILKSSPKKEKVLMALDGSVMEGGAMRVTNVFRVKVFDPLEVSCLVESSYKETGIISMCIICLQSMVSTAGFGERDIPMACGVVALLFAEKMVKVPHTELVSVQNHQDYLNEDTFTMVLESLREGTDTYTSNCGHKNKMLGVDDIVLLNSHLDVRLKEEKSVECLVAEAFIDSVMNLQIREILLLLRWQNYKVLSAMRGQVNNDIVIFDCQVHMTANPDSDEEVEHGAFIYQILQSDIGTVRRTIKALEKYSGKLHGPCVLAVFQI